MRVAKPMLALGVLCAPALVPGARGQALPAPAWPAVITDIAPPPSARFPARWYPPDSDVAYTQNETAQRGHPYTAVMVTSTVFMNSAGQRKEIVQKTVQMRDSLARTRQEQDTVRMDKDGKTVAAHDVSVHDPVSHCNFQWLEPWIGPGKPVATVLCNSRTLHYTTRRMYADDLVSTRTESHIGLTEIVKEPLGRKEIEHLDAVGVRTTKTQHDQNGVTSGRVTSELWYSPELEEMLRFEVVSDQPGGALPSFRLTEIERGDPEAALFYPPAAYEILSNVQGKP